MTENKPQRQFRFVQPENDHTAYENCKGTMCKLRKQCSRSNMKPEVAFDLECPYLEEIDENNGSEENE